jgi:hypothetical protein
MTRAVLLARAALLAGAGWAALAVSLASPAQALGDFELVCLAPVVVVGDPGGWSLSVRIEADDAGWRVWHTLGGGRVIARQAQYEMIDARRNVASATVQPWTGWYGTLRRNPKLMMVGGLRAEAGGIVYEERLVDFGRDPHGVLILDSKAYCGPAGQGLPLLDAGGAPPEAGAVSQPSAPLQLGLLPSVPATGEDRVPAGGEAVPITIEGERAHIAVMFGDYPAAQPMVIDTGASIMSISAGLAAILVGRGDAVAGGWAQISLADGSSVLRQRVVIGKLMIGAHRVSGVEAIIHPDAADMLLPFGVLSRIGRFTIDARRGVLIFG